MFTSILDLLKFVELILLRPRSLLSGTVEVLRKPLPYPRKSVKNFVLFELPDNSNIGSANGVSLGCGYIFYWPITYF